MPPTLDQQAKLLASFESQTHEIEIFMSAVRKWFDTHPRLRSRRDAAIHSVKSRLKDREHFCEKIGRKWDDGNPITPDNLFRVITDLAGVRVLHLYQEQFAAIHREIMDKINIAKDWALDEPPKAYSWDPESRAFFEKQSIDVEIKESFYTSVHYLVRPRADSPLCCEIQVRTLFEEIWGEVDHILNYPKECEEVACREQLRVLAKLVGAGSRLVDSVFRTWNARAK